MDDVRVGFYEHFKGSRYEVTGIAIHSESQEELVLYHPLESDITWARPKRMFLETIEHNGDTVPRFKYLGRKI